MSALTSSGRPRALPPLFQSPPPALAAKRAANATDFADFHFLTRQPLQAEPPTFRLPCLLPPLNSSTTAACVTRPHRTGDEASSLFNISKSPQSSAARRAVSHQRKGPSDAAGGAVRNLRKKKKERKKGVGGLNSITRRTTRSPWEPRPFRSPLASARLNVDSPFGPLSRLAPALSGMSSRTGRRYERFFFWQKGRRRRA